MATTLSVKLLVDRKSQKVVFAECGKDFIDFLFGLLVLPLGSVGEVLTKENMVGDVGAIGQLLESVKDMDEAYILPGQQKADVLCPKVLSPFNKPLLLQLENVAVKRKYYACPNIDYSSYRSSRCKYVSDVENLKCPQCNNRLSMEISYVDPKGSTDDERGGFVREMVIYMVTDDLKVTPVSAISAITLFKKFNINEVGALEEKAVEVGCVEGSALLKASLQSKTVLTDVFLGKSRENSHNETLCFK